MERVRAIGMNVLGLSDCGDKSLVDVDGGLGVHGVISFGHKKVINVVLHGLDESDVGLDSKQDIKIVCIKIPPLDHHSHRGDKNGTDSFFTHDMNQPWSIEQCMACKSSG